MYPIWCTEGALVLYTAGKIVQTGLYPFTNLMHQSRGSGLEADLADDIPEVFALETCELKLKIAGLAGAIDASEGSGTPRGSTADLGEVGELREGGRVAERDKNDPVVGEGRDRVDDGGFFSNSCQTHA